MGEAAMAAIIGYIGGCIITFGIPTGELIKGIVPFFIGLIVFLGILIAFPEITLWLPNMMRG